MGLENLDGHESSEIPYTRVFNIDLLSAGLPTIVVTNTDNEFNATCIVTEEGKIVLIYPKSQIRLEEGEVRYLLGVIVATSINNAINQAIKKGSEWADYIAEGSPTEVIGIISNFLEGEPKFDEISRESQTSNHRERAILRRRVEKMGVQFPLQKTMSLVKS